MTTARRDLQLFGGLLRRFLRPYWRSVALAVVLNVVVGLLVTLRPLVLAPALDSFVATRSQPAGSLGEITLNNVGATLARVLGLDPSNPLRTGVYVALLFLAITGVAAGLGFASHLLLSRTRALLHRDMTVALHGHLLSLPLAYFHKRRAGELSTRLTHDVIRVTNSLDAVARGIIQSLAQVCVALVVLFRTDMLFSLGILVMGSSHLLITRALGNRVRRFSEALSDRQADVGARLFETFIGIRTVKSFAAERFDARGLRDVAESFRAQYFRARILGEVDAPIRLVADALAAGAVLVLTFSAVSQGRLTLQAAALFFYLSQQLLGPISQLFKQWLMIAQTVGGAMRVVEMFETRTQMLDGAKIAGELQDRIVLEHVSFAFEKGRPVLSGIDLEVRRGETVAIVGPSGSGKTTLADVILRLFDVDEGAIRYDGTDIREFKQTSYRRNFGVVPQDGLLFNTTVRENIVYNREFNQEDLAHAVWAANADEFIRELPQGLDTVVGDRGVRLSGGQRQRVAIARAVYGRPSLLVLDEATSSLDSESERAVQKAIERIGREMTMIIIAHRLSTIVHADRIVVLDRGRIEAEGPHGTVLEASPTYRKLYRLQAPAPVGSVG
jgi:subfamily B ATP-binding cassette protein MsbA